MHGGSSFDSKMPPRKNRRICFVAPHPDDIELYCGGSLLAHAHQQDILSVIMMTRGGLGTNNPFRKGAALEKIREQEARRRYQLLADLQLIFLDFKDGAVLSNHEAVAELSSHLQTLRPDLIYCPEMSLDFSERRHSDHIHTGRIISEASLLLNKDVILRYYHSKFVNYFIDVQDYIHTNNKAIHFYRSQLGMSVWPFLSGLNFLHHCYNKKRRNWGRKLGTRYAEGFREVVLDGT